MAENVESNDYQDKQRVASNLVRSEKKSPATVERRGEIVASNVEAYREDWEKVMNATINMRKKGVQATVVRRKNRLK